MNTIQMPSQSVVQVSGTRFLSTSKTFILLRLVAKLYRHCTVDRAPYNIYDYDYDYNTTINNPGAGCQKGNFPIKTDHSW